jgi:tetratricopeptide (TPR) repeat protein
MLRRSGVVVVLLYAGGLLGNIGRADESATATEKTGKIETVYLHVVPDHGTDQKQFQRILIRELFRQSFLLAAREDYGLCTRDEALGESCAPAPVVATFLVDVLFLENKPGSLRIDRDLDSKLTTVLEVKLDVDDKSALDYEHLVKIAEELTTTQFAKILEAAGCQKRDCSDWAKAAVSPEVALQLSQMRIISQFSAARELHRVHAKARATAATHDALVRCYANLGLLTSFLCHPAHKVFKARALLYAERFQRQAPDDPAAWWLRGYALALTGLPAAALDSIAHADQLLAKAEVPENTDHDRPRWAAPVEQFCQYEIEQLDAPLADDDLKELTQLLQFMAVNACRFSTQTVQTAIAVLPKQPECYLVHDALCAAGGVSISHEATQIGPRILAGTLHQRLSEVPGLPVNVTQAADRRVPFKNLMKELDISGKQPAAHDEISWSVLSRLLREVMFMQVMRRLDFMVYMLGVDSDDFIQEMAPFVADHPYQGFLETRRWQREPREAAAVKLKQELNTSNMDVNCVNLFARLRGADDLKAQLFRTSYAHGDMVEPDLVYRLARFSGKKNTANELIRVSPYASFPLAVLIDEDWDYAEPHLVEWEQRYLQRPGMQKALGSAYLEIEEFDDAERCLTRALKLAPDQVIYEQLAAVYAARGDRTKWKATLDEFLTKPDYRLSHAQVRVKIAEYYMDQQQWNEALPYALDAAESGAAWAMKAASRCYEGLRDYDESEKWLLRIVERYRDSEYSWYEWCHRTGHGDLKAARAAIEARIKRNDIWADGESPYLAGLFYVAEHRPEQAYPIYARIQQTNHDPWAGMFAALLADELKRPADRDAALRLIAATGSKYETNGRQRKSLIALAKLWSETLATPNKKLDLAAVKQLREKAGFDRSNFSYFAGRIAQSQGDAEEGKELLVVCAQSTKTIRTSMLARALLREQGVKAEEAWEKPAAKPAASTPR